MFKKQILDNQGHGIKHKYLPAIFKGVDIPIKIGIRFKLKGKLGISTISVPIQKMLFLIHIAKKAHEQK